MSLDLAAFEAGAKYAGAYESDLRAIQSRLAKVQVAYITQRTRAIIVVEGWDAAGKGSVIRRLVASWDPRWFTVRHTGPPREDAAAQHFLRRFWEQLPDPGCVLILDRSWYGRVLVERVEGLCSAADWQRAYDEINAFEDQQRASGTPIIKIFLHITQEEQDSRLLARLRDPWKRWKTGPDDYRNRGKRAEYRAAYEDMLAHCHTRWAPWTLVDANSKKSARMAFLNAVADQLAAHVDLTPPPMDPELERLAGLAFQSPDLLPPDSSLSAAG